MLRVGLTGGLGSGKSTVASLLRSFGAQVIEADNLGRALMEPGQQVYADIVRAFGPDIVALDGRLDRARLAALAFQGGRINELNAIVHPAVIAAQCQWMESVFARDPAAVAVVESALIFEVERDARARGESETLLADWKHRIDRVVVVTAPDEVKIARYAARISPSPAGRTIAQEDARVRLAHQIPDSEKIRRADYVLDNTRDEAALRVQVEALWQRLTSESNNSRQKLSLE
ncbi:MAG: dephospho-CoA kinase [Terracidiphilus sp.]|jgi:dephospho-CoA kinase